MAKEGCGADSVAWLKTALDPFHDFDTTISGIPDVDTEYSVVEVIPSVTSITAPPDLQSGETWSCQVVFLPTMGSSSGASWFAEDDQGGHKRRSYDGGQNTNVGTVTVVSHGDTSAPGAWSESSTYLQEEAFGKTSRTYTAISAATGGTGLKKLVAGGFEVHNDTAALYKQGSVTVFETPQANPPKAVIPIAVGSLSVFNEVEEYTTYRLPPANRTEAAAHPASRTWEAAHGVYVPMRLGPETQYQSPARGNFALGRRADLDSDLPIPNSGYQQLRVPGGEFYTESWQGRFQAAGISTTGAYFSGLSPETVLTLTVKFIVETAPTPANPQFLHLATPTPLYCPKALEMYRLALRHLPPGVKVGMNEKGDWYRMVSSVLNSVAPIVMPFMPAPVAAATGTALAVNNAIGKGIAEHKKNSVKVTTVAKNVSKPNRR